MRLMKQKSTKAVLDSHAFKTIIDKEMKQEHKELLGNHLVQIGYKILKDKSGKTIDDVMADMKNVLINLKKLKDSYGK